jgi:HK97 family phage prohead protease
VFNRETVIDSWEGRFREKIAPGAMKRSFQEAPPRVQFDHGQHPLIGSIPIGSVESIREDSHPTLAPEGGAHIIARLHDNWLIEPVRDAIKSGSVDGMSFRFSVLQDEWRTTDGKIVKDQRELEDLLFRSWAEEIPDEELLLRTLRQLKVPEVGPVVWPAYSDTSVGVRSQTITIDLGRLHEPDQRSLLAQAVLMTDRADAETQDPTPSVRDEAEVHVKPVNDAQHVTPTADEHESASKRHEVQAELARVRANNIRANSQKERYSS